MDFKVLSFNIDPKKRDPAKNALVELLARTQPDVVAFQECPWTASARGTELERILGRAFPNGNWRAEQVKEGDSKYNTVLYNAKCFSAQLCTFEGLGINPGDNKKPYELRQHVQSAAWLPTRYVLLQLTSLSNTDLHFYLLNWHGPQSGQKNVGKAINNKQLLMRAALLVQKVGLQWLVGVYASKKHKPVVIAGDFNHTLTQQEVDAWLSNFVDISFAFHDGSKSCWHVAEQRYQQQTPDTADAAAALNIRDSITYHSQSAEIDRICSIRPTCASPGTSAADGPLLALVCNEAAATCVKVHAGFTHGPRIAKFSLGALPSSPGANGPSTPAPQAPLTPQPSAGGQLQSVEQRQQSGVVKQLDMEESEEGSDTGGAPEERAAPGATEERAAQGATRAGAALDDGFYLLPAGTARLVAGWDIGESTEIPQGFMNQGNQALQLTLHGAEALVDLSDVMAHLLLAPVDSTGGDGNAAMISLASAGVVYSLAGPQLPDSPTALVDSRILVQGRDARHWDAGADGKVLVLARPEAHGGGPVRQRTLVTPARLEAELALAMQRKQISAAQLAAAEAALAWCSKHLQTAVVGEAGERAAAPGSAEEQLPSQGDAEEQAAVVGEGDRQSAAPTAAEEQAAAPRVSVEQGAAAGQSSIGTVADEPL